MFLGRDLGGKEGTYSCANDVLPGSRPAHETHRRHHENIHVDGLGVRIRNSEGGNRGICAPERIVELVPGDGSKRSDCNHIDRVALRGCSQD